MLCILSVSSLQQPSNINSMCANIPRDWQSAAGKPQHCRYFETSRQINEEHHKHRKKVGYCVLLRQPSVEIRMN